MKVLFWAAFFTAVELINGVTHAYMKDIYIQTLKKVTPLFRFPIMDILR